MPNVEGIPSPKTQRTRKWVVLAVCVFLAFAVVVALFLTRAHEHPTESKMQHLEKQEEQKQEEQGKQEEQEEQAEQKQEEEEPVEKLVTRPSLLRLVGVYVLTSVRGHLLPRTGELTLEFAATADDSLDFSGSYFDLYKFKGQVRLNGSEAVFDLAAHPEPLTPSGVDFLRAIAPGGREPAVVLLGSASGGFTLESREHELSFSPRSQVLLPVRFHSTAWSLEKRQQVPVGNYEPSKTSVRDLGSYTVQFGVGNYVSGRNTCNLYSQLHTKVSVVDGQFHVCLGNDYTVADGCSTRYNWLPDLAGRQYSVDFEEEGGDVPWRSRRMRWTGPTSVFWLVEHMVGELWYEGSLEDGFHYVRVGQYRLVLENFTATEHNPTNVPLPVVGSFVDVQPAGDVGIPVPYPRATFLCCFLDPLASVEQVCGD